MSKNNEKISNEVEAFNDLDKIVDEHGVELIRRYLKTYNKKSRKLQKKGNKCDEVAIEVYGLVISGEYDITNAMYKVSLNRNTAEKTIKNHKDAFYREAKREYLTAYKYYWENIGEFKDGFTPILYQRYDGFYEQYYSNYYHLKEIHEEKLVVYEYLFEKVFPTKKDIREKKKEIEEKFEIPF